MRFISRLLDILFPLRSTAACVREATWETVAPFITPTTHQLDEYTCTTLLPYRTKLVRALIIEAKFNGNIRAQELLAAVLRDYLIDREDVVLVPIPLGRKRLRERGYNQVEEIAKRATRGMEGCELMPELLTRTRDTLPQTEQSRAERVRNMHRAFSASLLDPATTCLILDDVTTTGATLEDAARALQEAGAAHIELIALAG